MKISMNKFWLNTKRHDKHSSLIKEIRASTDAAIRNQGASIKALEIQIRQMSKSITTTEEAEALKEDDKMQLIKLSRVTIPFPVGLRENRAYVSGDLRHKPEIEECEIIDEPKVDFRHDYEIVERIDEYPSFCDYDRKIHFAIVENIDAYRDKAMGDVIVRKPFCRVACVEAKRIDGFITIRDGNDSVTYQMVRSHPW
ncbi:hypothetical protein Tco_0117048 [Tanacetum coccineum]